jgi:multidrug resistance efflux pump
LHARVAALDKSKADLTLAQADFFRARQLLETAAGSRQEFDRAQRALSTANAQVTEALAEVYQVRASLGLPAQPDGGKGLDQVPPDLDQTFSTVLAAQAELIQTAAQLGVIHSYEQTPKQMVEEFEKQGDINRTFARLEAEAPGVKQAEAKLEFAKRELAQAELDLRYCDIVAKIDGVVTRRNVNPGDYVQVGQNLMAIRSLHEIWVDANFKETQLNDLYQVPVKPTHAADCGGFPKALECDSPWQTSGGLPWGWRFGFGKIMRRRSCVDWRSSRTMLARPGDYWHWQRSMTAARVARQPRSAASGYRRFATGCWPSMHRVRRG